MDEGYYYYICLFVMLDLFVDFVDEDDVFFGFYNYYNRGNDELIIIDFDFFGDLENLLEWLILFKWVIVFILVFMVFIVYVFFFY